MTKRDRIKFGPLPSKFKQQLGLGASGSAMWEKLRKNHTEDIWMLYHHQTITDFGIKRKLRVLVEGDEDILLELGRKEVHRIWNETGDAQRIARYLEIGER